MQCGFGTPNDMKLLSLIVAASLAACTGITLPSASARSANQCGEGSGGSDARLRDDLRARILSADKHRQLRTELGETMPSGTTMVLLHAVGGHLSTFEHSIIAYRSAEGRWSGTAVGRSKIWVEGAPFQPIDKKEWVLSDEAATRLDQILGDRCFYSEPTMLDGKDGPPNRGAMFVTLDVVTAAKQRSVSYLGGTADGLTAEVDRLVRPR